MEPLSPLRTQRFQESGWARAVAASDPSHSRSNARTSRRGYKRTPAQEREYRRLRRKLARVKAQRLRPLRDTPEPQTDGRPNVGAPSSAMD